MVYRKKVKIKGQYYWYLFHTVRDKDKYLKKSKYIGKELPKNIDEIEKNFEAEISKQPEEKFSNLVQGLHPLERKVLPYLKNNATLKQIEKSSKLQEVEAMRALQWLENKNMLKIKKDAQEFISLDKNGRLYLKEGLPERRFLNSLSKPLTLPEITKKAKLNQNEISITLGLLRKKQAINLDKGKVFLTKKGKELQNKKFLEEEFLNEISNKSLELDNLSPEQKNAFNELKNRKNILKIGTKKEFTVTLTEQGKKLTNSKIDTHLIDTLTTNMLKKGSWKNKKFRYYDVSINVPKIYPAKRHFVNQALTYIKRIWLDLGFQEMTGPILPTSFWNFDALFVPQDHPARELQDTLFTKNPKYGDLPKNKQIITRVKAAHEYGWNTGSSGWKYTWDEKLARKLALRTHTTILSAKTIAQLKESDLPVKFFSVGKCFRNETVDWSHLFEFNQTEGIVVGENVNFRHLLGYLKEFFTKMGFEKARFRPAYFPYTEPSVEIDVFHPVHKKWFELGGAGIFRPEVVKPLLGIDVPVLAWGPGADRLIMDYYKIHDIRDLYKNDLKQLREIKPWLK